MCITLKNNSLLDMKNTLILGGKGRTLKELKAFDTFVRVMTK
mgnify:FL=1